MQDETRPTLFECQFIELSNILTDEEYDQLSDYLSDHFTWGDTSIVLVTQDQLRDALDACLLKTSLPTEIIEKVYKAMDDVGSSAFVNLS